MKVKKSIKLPLTDVEKIYLRKHKVKIIEICGYTIDELREILRATPERSAEIHALATFQIVPSIGLKFAEDLVSLGYFAFAALKNKDGAKLTDEYERKKGYWIDPCLEDQFRLAIYFANTSDTTKNWWDFTEERKKYRLENGYPSDRPQKAWYETKKQ